MHVLVVVIILINVQILPEQQVFLLERMVDDIKILEKNNDFWISHLITSENWSEQEDIVE